MSAHSDCCFFAPCTNILTYLLIYVFTRELDSACRHGRTLSWAGGGG